MTTAILNERVRACADACADCVESCEACAQHYIEGGLAEMAEYI